MTLSDSEPKAAPEPARTPTSDLNALRVEIDRIDTALHRLLMDRGEIIDRLIAVKARQGGGSAFRPAREADMMRRLVTRHAGILPLDTVEGIWRIIISTFTYVQAPYTVHADIAGGDPAMRDSCRFHFGFTVPLVTHAGTAAVIAAVAEASGDLGLIAAEGPAGSAWWDALVAPAAPKIIARLPFVERAGHAAGLPLFVVARPLTDAAVSDVCLYALEDAARPDAAGAAIEVIASHAIGASRSGADGHADGQRLVVAAPGSLEPDAIAAACTRPGHARPHLAWIGSHARRFEVADR